MGCKVALVVVAEVFGSATFMPPTSHVRLLVIAQDAIMRVHLGLCKGESFLCKIVHLVLCLLGAVAVHATNTGVSRVDAVASSDLANSLANFTESLDALCNGAHRLLCRERVNFHLSPREVKIGQDENVMQCNAVQPVRD